MCTEQFGRIRGKGRCAKRMNAKLKMERFGRGALYFLGGLLALGLFCSPISFSSSNKASAPINSMTTQTNDGVWLIEYYIATNRLSYAVISGPKKNGVHGAVTCGGSSTNGSVWANLREPDGSEISIFDTGRIFQITDDKVSECPEKIDGRDFTAFLDGHHGDYSISALLNFVHHPHTRQ